MFELFYLQGVFSFSMSYHRVLPLPEPLHSNLTPRCRQADDLLQHKIMTNDKDSTTPKRARSPVSSHQSSSPVIDKAPSSPITSSLEDNVDSQKGRARAASQASSIERRRLPSISKAFQLESPSDICLCQPDPKVPRPRNGMQAYPYLISSQ